MLFRSLFELGNVLEGLQKGGLILVAGRPRVGKTALALNLAEMTCFDRGLPAAIITSRESGTDIFTRLLCSIGDLDCEKIQSGQLDDDDWRRLTEATGRLVGIPFTVCEDRQMSPSSLRHQVQRLHRPSGRDKIGRAHV